MQIAEVIISSVYPRLACHELLKFKLYLIILKTFPDKNWNRSTMFLATRVRRLCVQCLHYLRKKERVIQ